MKEIRDEGFRQCLAQHAMPPGMGVPPAQLHAALHTALSVFLAAAAQGTLSLHLPQCQGAPEPRGDGHFHLSPELFLQQHGWTEFRFPTGTCRLQAGEALLVPPQLRHAERVGGDGPQGFRNLVVFADDAMLTCHLALERAPGQPGIAHLESRHNAHATRVHHWLSDATRAGAGPTANAWATAQARALVAAALAGVLRALQDSDTRAASEPPLVARVRVLIHNQLGEHTLSVQGLADQSGCSADHLSHVFRQSSGEALVACINRLRMQRATQLLRDTQLSVKEVAWACGFAAPSYFIRVFRQHQGVTPQTWRHVPANASATHPAAGAFAEPVAP